MPATYNLIVPPHNFVNDKTVRVSETPRAAHSIYAALCRYRYLKRSVTAAAKAVSREAGSNRLLSLKFAIVDDGAPGEAVMRIIGRRVHTVDSRIRKGL